MDLPTELPLHGQKIFYYASFLVITPADGGLRARLKPGPALALPGTDAPVGLQAAERAHPGIKHARLAFAYRTPSFYG